MFLFLFALLLSLSSAGPAPDVFNVKLGLGFHHTGAPADSFVVLTVNRSLAPNGVDRFYQLLTLRNGSYFANNGFFRVVPHFVVQFGIAGDPELAQQWENKNIEDDPVVGSNVRGTIAFADAGPNTRSTQVFFNYANNSFLDEEGFAPFGSVRPQDMQLLEAIYSKYGGAPSQQEIYAEGNEYLKQNYPLLTYLTTTTIE